MGPLLVEVLDPFIGRGDIAAACIDPRWQAPLDSLGALMIHSELSRGRCDDGVCSAIIVPRRSKVELLQGTFKTYEDSHSTGAGFDG